jgi:hypothetical protein
MRQGRQRRAGAVPTFADVLLKVGTLRFAHPTILRSAGSYHCEERSDDGDRHAFSFPRHDLPELCNLVVPPLGRGRRESRAPTAPVARVRKKAHGVELQVQPRHPGFPRAMVLRLIRALPGEAAFLAPVVSAIIRAGVAPGSRRQDHTTSPSAASVSSGEGSPDACSVHRLPRQRAVTIAIRPPAARDGRNLLLFYEIVKPQFRNSFSTYRKTE